MQIEVERLMWVIAEPPMTYPNGDRCQFLTHGFRARWAGGQAHVADDESSAVGWFPIDQLPEPRHPRLDAMVACAAAETAEVAYCL